MTIEQDLTKDCVKWIKTYFKYCGNGCNAVIGISGGKDSSVVAALCCKALGPERVIGVMMPNGIQKDIGDSRKICEFLGIKNLTVDISSAYNDMKRTIFNADSSIELSQQTLINLAPRIRMTALYGISQSMNGRVSCNSNFDEALMGYCTLWGDCAGDFAPLRYLHVSQVVKIGDELGLPHELTHKAPADGLTGQSDEDKMGFSYADVEHMYKLINNRAFQELTVNEKKAWDRMKQNSWKEAMLNVPSFTPNNF